MAEINFNNAIGGFRLYQDKIPYLNVQLEPGMDDETDVLDIQIPNLKYVGLGEYSDQTDKYYNYTFGMNNENKLTILLANTPAIQFGGLFITSGLIHISRLPNTPDHTPVFQLFTELHTVLQAEVRRQVRVRGRNLLGFQQVLQGRERGTQKVPERLKDPENVASVIGSFLSGKSGSIPQQIAELKRNARRRKTRRRS